MNALAKKRIAEMLEGPEARARFLGAMKKLFPKVFPPVSHLGKMGKMGKPKLTR